MILKDVDEQAALDKYQKAGLSAEKQMAFYLKRAFGNEENVLVINSLRLEKLDDAAQIDHLILHEYGMIIVESKSVSTKVSVNEYGEWERLVDGKAQGMPSPVKQAQRQAEFLKKYLTPFTDVLLKKVVGIQLKFDKMPIDLIVAISDQGIINRPKKHTDELDYIRKADQVVDKINEVLAVYKKEDALLRLSLKTPYYLGENGRKNTSQFLLKRHKPYTSGAPQKTVAKKTAPQQKAQQEVVPNADKQWPKCGKCNGNSVEVAYGKYGYYIKCKECEQNTAIKKVCPSCNDKLRVRKQKESFFLECGKCETSKLFHVNR
jgi:transcription elongation factor Elf1